MFKLLLLLLLSANLSALDNDPSNSMLPTTTTIIIYGVGGAVVVVGGVIAAPLVLPAGTIVIIQTAAATVGTQILAAGTYVISNLSVYSWISIGVSGARTVRPYIIQTLEEELVQLIKDEAAELLEEKTQLSKCLLKNKVNLQRDSSGCPLACQDIAFTYAILAGEDEFNKVIKSLQ